MATASLWPTDLPAARPRGMRHMLLDAGVELAELTGGRLDLFVDTQGDAAPRDGTLLEFTHTGSLRARRHGFLVALFNVRTGPGPFPARVSAADGQTFEVQSEEELREALSKVFHAPRTKEVLLSMLANLD